MSIKQLEKEYWTLLQEHIRSQNNGVRPQPACAREWMYLKIDADPAFEIASHTFRNHTLSMCLRIQENRAKEYYAKLIEEQKTIEQELGCELSWRGDREPGPKPGYQLQCHLRNCDLEDRSRWPEYVAWQADMAEQFRKCFRPRIKRLNLELDDLGD